VFSIEELKEKAAKMQSYLEKPYKADPEELIERMNYLGILIAQSGQCLADARYYQDTIVNGAIMEALQKAYEERLSASTINKFVTSAAKEQNLLVNTFDRINASAVHQIDAMRTIISYRKSEMNLV
jgi:hypothetical protein